MVTDLCQQYGVSEQRSCRTPRLNRATQQYQSRRAPYPALQHRVQGLGQSRVRSGYRTITVLLKPEGWAGGRRLVYRLYREEGLALHPRSLRHGQAVVTRRETVKVTKPNEAWSWDAVADQLADGRHF